MHWTSENAFSCPAGPYLLWAWSALVDTHLPTLQRCHEETEGSLTWFEAMTGLAYKYF